MNTAIILCGGKGSRFSDSNTPMPKQYSLLLGKPVFVWSLTQYQLHPEIDQIVIVASKDWHPLITKWISNEKIEKFVGFAEPGKCRQESALNGMKVVCTNASENDLVIFQDSARPLVTQKMITDVMAAGAKSDGAVIAGRSTEAFCVCDQMMIDSYISDPGYMIESPDCYHLKPYYTINQHASIEVLEASRGCMHIATQNNLKVSVVLRSTTNIKITYAEDLFIAEAILSHR